MLTPGFNRPLASAFAQISDLVMKVVPLRQCCRHKHLIVDQESTALALQNPTIHLTESDAHPEGVTHSNPTRDKKTSQQLGHTCNAACNKIHCASHFDAARA